MLDILAKKLKDSTNLEKNCSLMFDEMDINKSYSYDSRNKIVYGGKKKLQVVMVRSLFASWKHIVYIGFDTSMTKGLLTQIVTECENYGVLVRAVTCDMGNQRFNKDLDFLNLNNKMVNPIDHTRSIYFFPDVPHLLKLIRNHLMDKRFSFPDEDGKLHELNKSDFYKLLNSDGHTYKLCPKFTTLHIEAKGGQRQNVRLAAQILSETVAQALRFNDENMNVQAAALLIFNRWFDTMNSRNKLSSNPYDCGLGMNETIQFQAHNDMEKVIKSLIFNDEKDRTKMIPFQRGILINIKSTEMLYEDLKSEGIKYIITKRLNQDALENLFSRVRGIGGQNTHPTATLAMNRLRILMMGKNTYDIVKKPVVEVECEAPISESVNLSNEVQSDEKFVLEELITDLDIPEDPEDEMDENLPNLNKQEVNNNQAKLYTAGYISRKSAKKFPKYNNSKIKMNSQWISCKSRGMLTYPDVTLMRRMHYYDKMFDEFHGKKINMNPFPLERLLKKILPRGATNARKFEVQLYIKIRFYKRIKDLNAEIKQKSSESRHNRSARQKKQFIN